MLCKSYLNHSNNTSAEAVNVGITIVSNAIILDTAQQQPQVASCANAYLLYDNLLNQSGVTYTSSQVEAADSAGALALSDGNTNIKFKASAGGNITIDCEMPLAKPINSMAVAGANLGSALVTWRFYVWDADLASYVLKSEGSGKKNNSPIFNTFEATASNKVRFEFATNSAIEIGELGVGAALRFPVPASVGYQPGRWSTNDETFSGRTESNAFSSSTIIARGTTEQVEFAKLQDTWLDENWIDVIEKSNGRPVWFGQDMLLNPNKVIFGNMTVPKPKYDSAFRSSLQIKIDGVV